STAPTRLPANTSSGRSENVCAANCSDGSWLSGETSTAPPRWANPTCKQLPREDGGLKSRMIHPAAVPDWREQRSRLPYKSWNGECRRRRAKEGKTQQPCSKAHGAEGQPLNCLIKPYGLFPLFLVFLWMSLFCAAPPTSGNP
ncbi:hypothetical protein AAFF_G00251620, partial [Aldrovandia affinis]